MALKPLTAEGRFECGLDSVVRDKVWAFVPVISEHGAGLGVAVANESGYRPIPLHWARADTYDEMAAHADALNEAEGLTLDTAARIVVSTMNGRPYRS